MTPNKKTMKRKLLAAALALLMTSGAAAYADDAADRDTTPVTKCNPKIRSTDTEGLPPSVSIEVYSWSDTEKVCYEMLRVLEGVRNKDITRFEKAVAVLHYWKPSYGTDNMQTLKELIEIVRLRGLYDKPARWDGTTDLVVRLWQVNGAIGPDQIVAFLRSAGSMAKTLDDGGLLS